MAASLEKITFNFHAPTRWRRSSFKNNSNYLLVRRSYSKQQIGLTKRNISKDTHEPVVKKSHKPAIDPHLDTELLRKWDQYPAHDILQHGWLMDSGASAHYTPYIQNLGNLRECCSGENVQLADGFVLPITHCGDIYISTCYRIFRLGDVFYSPQCDFSILSVGKFCSDNGVSMEFCPDHVIVKDLVSGTPLLYGEAYQGLYMLQAEPRVIREDLEPANALCF